jgi:hypothetical protein
MIIILLGILGAIISAIIGTFWYSMSTPMGRLHMESVGFNKLSKEEKEEKIKMMKPKMWKYYLAQMFLSFLTSVFIAFIMLEQKAFGHLMIYAEVAGIWFCFIIPLIGQSLLWGNTDQRLRWKTCRRYFKRRETHTRLFAYLDLDGYFGKKIYRE